jgi:hypothetical protein
MAIEVRQMTIKSTVLQKGVPEDEDHDRSLDMEEIRADILEECKQMIIEVLRKQKER